MPFITTKDGVEIFYKDWGTGPGVRVQDGIERKVTTRGSLGYPNSWRPCA